MLKLTSNTVEKLSFHVPRKSDAFQDDIFPDTFAGIPAHSADEWFAGSDLPPVLRSLNPAQSGSSSYGSAGAGAGAASGGMHHKSASVGGAIKTSAQLQRELDAANARIAELEGKLAAAGIQA